MKISKFWNYNAKEQVLGLMLKDLTQDGRKELLAYSKSGKLYILSSDGQVLNNQNVTENSSIWCAKISDINQDNSYELLLGALDGLLRTFRINKSLEIIPLWAHQFGASISGILIDDINQDDQIEVIAYGLDKSLRVLSPFDGTLLWGQVFEDGISDAVILTGKMNKKLIIAAGNDGTVRSFDGTNGDLLNFARFSDKVRCVSSMRSNDTYLIICGGDDKKAHFTNIDLKQEIKTLSFDEILWKIDTNKKSIFLSTYSFDFLNDNVPKENIIYSSKLLCLDESLNMKWEIKNINTEVFIPCGKNLFLGTTNGTLMVVDIANGNIISKVNTQSCINDIKYDSQSNRFFTCHDNGSINSYFID